MFYIFHLEKFQIRIRRIATEVPFVTKEIIESTPAVHAAE